MRNILIIGAIAIILGLFSLVLFGQNSFFQADPNLSLANNSTSITLPKVAEANATSNVANTQPISGSSTSSSSSTAQLATSAKSESSKSVSSTSISASSSNSSAVTMAGSPSMTGKNSVEVTSVDNTNLLRTGGAPDPCQQDQKSALCNEYKEYLKTKTISKR